MVLPERGTIIGARGKHTLSVDRIKILLALAEKSGESISFGDLADIVRLDEKDDLDILQRHLQAIRDVLGDTGPNPRFLVVDDDRATLIAPVQAGVSGQYEPDAEDDDSVPFLKQLQRRKVIRIGAGYIVLAWIVIQVADTVLPALGLPGWVLTLTIALTMLGFPVAVVIAWIFEVTPTGTLRDARRMPASLSGWQKFFDIAVLSSLAIVVGYFAVNVLFDVRRERDREAVELTPTTVTAPANTIAVLPFRQLGGTVETSYIGDGIAEEILRLLSRLPGLNVAARTASFYFKGKDVDAQTIAQKLHVRHLLSGSVQVVGNSILVQAELLDAASGLQLWSQRYDRELFDILEIQSDIARAVAEESEALLTDDTVAELDYRPTDNPEAYDFYLRGRDYLRQPRTSDVLENAQRLFHRALALDPGYALARAGLCETHLAIYIRTRSVATVDDAESDCRAALEFDDALPEVHSALGYLYWHTGDFDHAELEFRTAIEKNPKFYEAFAGLSDTLFSKNQYDQAETMLHELRRLQPGYWDAYRKLGAFYYRLGRDREALPYFRQVTELTPDNAPGWNNLGSVNYMLGHLELAANAWQRAIEIAPTQSMYANLGTMYYYIGDFEGAVEMQVKAIELAPNDFRLWGRMAAAYLQMENRDIEARAAYNKGIGLANEILAINANESDANKNVALFYAHTGDEDAAVRSIDNALALSPDDPDTHFFAALTYLALGDPEQSIEALKRAVERGYSKKIIVSEPAFDEIRDRDGFRVLIAETDADA